MTRTTGARIVVDRVPEVFDRCGLSACELRVLLTLLDRKASLAEIAAALGKPASEVTRAGRRLATRGLATMRALLAAAERAAEKPEPRNLTAA
jgi:DNA-binding MarR family transcriptional regulator